MILSGKELSSTLKVNIAKKVRQLTNRWGIAPHLAVILVGDNPASQSYVKGKSKACEEVGIKNITINLSVDISEQDLIKTINELNLNPSIHGILVQLPLPTHINADKIISAIDPKKDVDGFHPENVAKLWLGQDCIKPCTPRGIINLIDKANINLEGKNVVVIGRSTIVGLPVAKMCLDRNATVTICHSKTENLANITKQADVLIVAIGKPKFVTADMVKLGATVIDVGINRIDGKLCGDVDFDSVFDEKTEYITPVPGGVGPMTIACLMENTIECFLKQHLN